METTKRSTKEITIEGGAIISFYEYITGREKRAIEYAYLEQAKITQTSDGKGKSEMAIGGVSASVSQVMQDITLKAVIDKVTPVENEPITDKQKILDFILDLPEAQFDLVIKTVNQITETKKA